EDGVVIGHVEDERHDALVGVGVGRTRGSVDTGGAAVEEFVDEGKAEAAVAAGDERGCAADRGGVGRSGHRPTIDESLAKCKSPVTVLALNGEARLEQIQPSLRYASKRATCFRSLRRARRRRRIGPRFAGACSPAIQKGSGCRSRSWTREDP